MKSTPNPAGKAGKPISLAPYTVDEVMRKMLSLPASPKTEAKPKRASSQKKTKQR